MDTHASLPQGYEWLIYPHCTNFEGESGLLSRCAVSAAVAQDRDAREIYVLCSELKKNWGTSIMHGWGPSCALELQLQRYIYAHAVEKLKQPAEPILNGLHYEVSEEALDGWHFFQHFAPPKGESAAYVVPVIVPYDGILYGPRVALSGEDPGALLAAMTAEVVSGGFKLKEVPS